MNDRNKEVDLGTTLDHIAIAVRNIKTSALFFERLGMHVMHRERVTEQSVDTVTIHGGSTNIELLEPLSDNSPVGRFLARKGEGLHHIALQVEDITSTLDRCRHHGYKPLDDKPRKGANGRLIAFLDPKTTHGVLIELTQTDRTANQNQQVDI